jgi:phage terminase small subunit
MSQVKKLTDKQEAFCLEYLIDLNATQAAIRAGYSEKTAKDIACENLAKPNIKERIIELKAKRAKEVNYTAKNVLDRLIEIDGLDVIDILNPDGSIKAISEWPKPWRTSISGLDINEMVNGDAATVIKKIKWPDKLRNIELLGKHVDVKAWDKEQQVTNNIHNIMPVPTAASAESWESAAQEQQDSVLNGD